MTSGNLELGLNRRKGGGQTKASGEVTYLVWRREQR